MYNLQAFYYSMSGSISIQALTYSFLLHIVPLLYIKHTGGDTSLQLHFIYIYIQIYIFCFAIKLKAITQIFIKCHNLYCDVPFLIVKSCLDPIFLYTRINIMFMSEWLLFLLFFHVSDIFEMWNRHQNCQTWIGLLFSPPKKKFQSVCNWNQTVKLKENNLQSWSSNLVCLILTQNLAGGRDGANKEGLLGLTEGKMCSSVSIRWQGIHSLK